MTTTSTVHMTETSVNQKFLCFRNFDRSLNKLFVYGEGTYLGNKYITRNGITTKDKYPCLQLDNGEVFVPTIHPGGYGVKEQIISAYEDHANLPISFENVSIPSASRVSIAENVNVLKNNPTKIRKMQVNHREQVMFVTSKDGRVTICGKVVHQEGNLISLALGIAKRRRGDVLLKKVGRFVSRGRAVKKPFDISKMAIINKNNESFNAAIVRTFRETYEPFAEACARTPLPEKITVKYKMKHVLDA